MSGRVVTVGNAMVDVIARVPGRPERGGDVLAVGGRLEVGGGGFRAVAAARAAGADAVYAGRIGTGPLGDLVRTALERAGIAAPLPRVTGADTGFVLATVEPDGERTFVTVPGAESAAPALEGFEIGAADVVHVHGYGLVDPARAAAIAAFVGGLPSATTVLLDPGPFGADAEPQAARPLLGRVDWWSGNAREAAAVTGAGDAEESAALLGPRFRAGAVVRDGAAGCVLAIRGRAPLRLPAPAVLALDTTGAGDAHVGTFLAALARGRPALDAARSANERAARLVALDR